MTELIPFNLPGEFLRGSLHAHTNHSDGDLSAEALVDGAVRNGYDFLCITDHFRPEFNYPITDARSLGGNRITIIPSAELHVGETRAGKLWHFTADGLPFDFEPPRPGETAAELAQRARDAGAFVTIAHPGWYQLTLEDAQSLPAAHAVEIYNAGCQAMHDRGDGAYLVDGLLDLGRRILLTAVDDTHYHMPDLALAWVLVKSKDHSQASILSALKSGAFYSTQGPEIKSLRLVGMKLSIECTAAKRVLVNGQGYALAFKAGESITRTTIALENTPIAKSPWFRVIVTGIDGRRAWSNPYWFADLEVSD